MDLQTKQLSPLSEIYPSELSFDLPLAVSDPYARIRDTEDDWQPFADYRVRSTDIDLGGHMNNAAYIRAMLSAFSSAELKALSIGKMDVIFRSPCFEGETLSLQRRNSENGLELRIVKEGGTALLARIEST